MVVKRRLAEPGLLVSILVICAGSVLAQQAPSAHGDSEGTSKDPDLQEIPVHAMRLLEPLTVRGLAITNGNDPRLEQIVVRGEASLYALRMQLREAREHAWDVFNEINDNDDFDIFCSRETRPNTRIRRRECRPQYALDARSRAGTDFARRLQLHCPVGPAGIPDPQCLDIAMQMASADAQLAINKIREMDQRLDEEFERLAGESPELERAIQEYERRERVYRGVMQRRRN